MMVIHQGADELRATHENSQRETKNLQWIEDLNGGPTWDRTRDQLIMSQLL